MYFNLAKKLNKIQFNYITITWLLSSVILLINLNFLQWKTLGFFFSLIYLGTFFVFFIKNAFPEKKNLFVKLTFAITILFSEIAILGTFFYYPFSLNNLIISIIFSVITLFNIVIFSRRKQSKIKLNLPRKKYRWPIAVYFLLVSISFYYLITSQTLNSIRSPWEQVRTPFFTTYFLSTGLLFWLVLKNIPKQLTPFLAGTHLFLSSSVALIIYRIGFGFDPFIHIATESVILEKGLITPKPFYYIGQYSLNVILSKISLIPIDLINKMLVPSLAALIPIFIYNSVGKIIKKTKYCRNYLPIVFILLIPYGYFIMTTPYNLSVIFFLFTLILGTEYILTPKNKLLYFLLALSAASLTMHPIGGTASFIFLLNLFFKEQIYKKSKHLYLGMLALLTLSLPLLFVINSLLSGKIKENFQPGNINNIINIISSNIPSVSFDSNFHLIYDSAYFWGQNAIFILMALAILGFFILKKIKLQKIALPYLLTFIILFFNGIFIETFINFSELINYERNDYALRVISISFYCLLPLAGASWYLFFRKSRKYKIFNAFLIILISGLMTNILFFSYPRHNPYETGRGYSVSISDINAVKKIKELSGNEKYIVLGNQNLGAAALKTIGFQNYYKQENPKANEEHYFYSIPTGSTLYSHYLEMVYEKPERTVMEKAASLVNANNAYFVLNNYWTGSEIILQNAKKSADASYSIDNGKIHIFEYKNLMSP